MDQFNELSKREWEVAKLLLEGKSNKLIARALDRPEQDLPLAGPLAPADASPTALPEVFVSEAMVDLYGASPGTTPAISSELLPTPLAP